MSDQTTIICPHCHQVISIDQALTQQLQQRFQKQYEERLQQEKARLWKLAQEKAAEKVQKDLQAETTMLKEELKQKATALEQAQKMELQLRKQRVQLEEDKKTFELKVQRQLDLERKKVQEETARRILEEHHLKDAEKDKKLQDVLRANEELRRKLEQGSQQTQGEVLELELEHTLTAEFPYDQIVPVGKGVVGADIIQQVCDQRSHLCGTIIWESKRTKTWSDSWISKLKDDQRQAKAEIAVLVSQVLPKGVTSFTTKDMVYICDYTTFLALAKLLRASLIQLAAVKLSHIGKKEKMEVLWNYLTGTEFRHRIEAIVDSFQTMKQDLDKEKQAFTKIWAKREKQIQQVLDNTIGMHGDLQGLIGTSLPEIKNLQLPEIELESKILSDK